MIESRQVTKSGYSYKRNIESVGNQVPEDIPTFTKKFQSQVSVKEGESLTIDAKALPLNDQNMEMKWMFNNQPLNFGNILTL